MSDGLHPTSAAILRFIIAYKRWYAGNSPARRQIAEAVGRGLSVVHYQLVRLERAGRITTLHDDARSIAIPGATWTPPQWFITSGSQEMDGLTPMTRSVCRFIIQHMLDYAGASPSYREIMAGTGVLSTSLVAYHIKLLEAAGLVRRPMRGKARMIVVPGARWELGEVDAAGNGQNICALCDDEEAETHQEREKVGERWDDLTLSHPAYVEEAYEALPQKPAPNQ